MCMSVMADTMKPHPVDDTISPIAKQAWLGLLLMC